MSQVLFISDPHLGHDNILEFMKKPGSGWRGGTTIEEHDEWVIQQMLSVSPNKRTRWYILGDVAFKRECLPLYDRLPGHKILIMGNHDDLPSYEYLNHFSVIRGPLKAYGIWITHMPMAPDDLFGLPNIHGHQHYWPLKDDNRYFNACIEFIPDNKPISLDELRSGWLSEEGSCDKWEENRHKYRRKT